MARRRPPAECPAPPSLTAATRHATRHLRTQPRPDVAQRRAAGAASSAMRLRPGRPGGSSWPSCRTTTHLASLERLVPTLEHADSAPFARARRGRPRRCEHLRDEIEPRHGDCGARRLARHGWRRCGGRLAQRAARLVFRAERPMSMPRRCCCTPLTSRLAAARGGAIESWRRIPAPLAWMAEARFRLERPGRELGPAGRTGLAGAGPLRCVDAAARRPGAGRGCVGSSMPSSKAIGTRAPTWPGSRPGC